MSLFNVTLHKVRVGVIRATGRDDLETASPEDLWELLEENPARARIISEALEVSDVADTSRSCPICLAPLEITAHAKVSFIPGESLELGDPEKVYVRCVADPTHEVLPEQIALLTEELTSVT